MSKPIPYFESTAVTIYCGDCRKILPTLGVRGTVAADPPYQQTSLAWDRWPSGWLAAAATVTDSLWCFGSLRLFMAKAPEFADWKLSQDIIWQKHNGSNFHNDRFRRVHEQIAHFYRGPWASIYRKPVTTADATARAVRRKRRPPHTGNIAASVYVSQDGGPRLQRSVIPVRSCHGHATHETEKPVGILEPLVEYAVPPGGLMIDPFGGSGSLIDVARATGRPIIVIDVREECCALAKARATKPVQETA